MKLSVLDQSPINEGQSAADALRNTIALARHADRLGFTRFWVAEHHAMTALASPAPEILLARIAAETRRIRLGSGGVMLPHYSPLKVVEVFTMLNALCPGRIDLGLGRAPGGGPVEMLALRRERGERPWPDDFEAQLLEVLAFLERDFPPGHVFRRIAIGPDTPRGDIVWLLGSSMWSAQAAARCGLPYAFAHFFSGESTRAAIEHYRQRFQPSRYRARPEAMIAIGVICAETQAQADEIALSVRVLRRRLQRGEARPIAPPELAARELAETPAAPPLQAREWPTQVIGTPDYVRDTLGRIGTALQLDELMVVTIAFDQQARLRSFSLLAEAFELPADGT